MRIRHRQRHAQGADFTWDVIEESPSFYIVRQADCPENALCLKVKADYEPIPDERAHQAYASEQHDRH